MVYPHEISKQTARFRRRRPRRRLRARPRASRERPSESGSEGLPTGPNGVIGFRGAQMRRHGAGEPHEVRRRSANPLGQGVKRVFAVHAGRPAQRGGRSVFGFSFFTTAALLYASLPPRQFFKKLKSIFSEFPRPHNRFDMIKVKKLSLCFVIGD